MSHPWALVCFIIICVLSSMKENRVGEDTSQAGSQHPAGIPGPLPGSLSYVIIYWIFPPGGAPPLFKLSPNLWSKMVDL